MSELVSGGVESTPGVEHEVLTIEGSPLSLYAAGKSDRPTVVLFHGAMFDEARFIWDQLFPVLAEHFRVVAFDTPRHGKSRPWPGHMGHERLMRIFHSAVDELGLERFSAVGLSMGGGVAVEYASLHPDRVERMVVFEPGGLGDRLDKQFLTWLYIKTPGLSRVITRSMHRKTREQLRVGLDKLFVGGSKPTDPDRLLTILREEIDGKWRHRENDLDDWQLDSIGATRLTWNLLDRIPLIACPTLWLRGADSLLVKQHEMERAVALARTSGAPATLRVIPGAGHLLPLERPAEANQAVLEFLLSDVN